ncbi:MAG: Crp/Fnr family transcriptional regulator [Bacteroidales bacterium]|nr:Crp/Fnr family transcriptional regulator [Bacteroidales bacterium]
MDNRMENCITCKYKSQLFEKLSEEQLKEISSSKKTVFVSKGDMICREGESITSFVYLVQGLIKLHKMDRFGRDQIVSIAKPLDFVGLLTLFSDKTYKYSITALQDSTLCFVDIELMKKFVTINGAFALEVMKNISAVSDDIIKKTYAINSKNLRGRIALVLSDFADSIFGSYSFDLPISRKEIGELIDMTPENVIRILSEFRRDGLINLKGKSVEILNKSMLLKIRDLG